MIPTCADHLMGILRGCIVATLQISKSVPIALHERYWYSRHGSDGFRFGNPSLPQCL
jgi:hypothetical protein